MKRQRGRNRNKSNHNNHNNSNRNLDSNGPDVKVRGSASHIYEKYTTLARDAAASGSRVKAENYLQHAEHYLRLVNTQEAAKQAAQAAREEADAARAARGERNDDESDGEGTNDSRSRRHPPRVKRGRDNAPEGAKDDAAKANDASGDKSSDSDTPDGLEVVQPQNDIGDAAVKTEPKRRRKAPKRKAPDDAERESPEEVTAAE